MAPGSETRDTRIAEYHVVRDNPVVGVEEGTMLRVEGGRVTVAGTGRVKLFQQSREPRWFVAGQEVELEPLGK